MNYENTLKQYFKYPKDFKERLQKRISSPCSFSIPLEITGHTAFFCLDMDIFHLLLRLHQKDLELKACFDKLPESAKTRYIRNTLLLEVKMTNEIEGVFSTKKEIFELAEDLQKRESNKIGSIVASYLTLLTKDVPPIKTCGDVRRLYDVFFSTDSRNSLIAKADLPDGLYFRTKHVGVFDASTNKEIHSGITGEDKIVEAVQEALFIYNDEKLDSFLRIALFHFIFEYAHPFYDGNGRIGRLLVSMLAKEEISDLLALRISSAIHRERSAYYKAFEETEDVRNYADLSTFVYSFLSIIEKDYDRSIEYAKEQSGKYMTILAKAKSLLPKLGKHEFAVLAELTQAYLFSDYGVDLSTIARDLSLSDQTARRIALKFADQGLVKRLRISKTYYYSLKEGALTDNNGQE